MTVLAYQLDFQDDGAPEFGVLHRGDKESCEKVAALIPAISYSGDRPIKECRIVMFEESPQ